jgi:electron transfer flavoprotein alpha subunit
MTPEITPESPSPVVAIVPVRAGELCTGGAEALAEAFAAGGSGILAIQHDGDLSEDLATYTSENVRIVVCGDFAPAKWSQLLGPLVHESQVIVLPASPDGRDLAPRLAAGLQRPLLAGALQITAHQISVPRNFGTELHRFDVDQPVVATLQVGVRGIETHEFPEPVNDQHVISQIFEDVSTRDVLVEKVLEPDVATMDLAEAPRIMGGGAGLTSAEDFELLGAVAHQLGASMGATRVITDRGWIHHDRQIGTTGVIVDPDLYLAWGISGAVQHTAGLGHPTHIISINTDPHCPMMQLADIAIVSDAPHVLRHLAQKLESRDV